MSMFKPCPKCGTSNNRTAKVCRNDNCDHSFSRRYSAEPEKVELDPYCGYSSSGTRCPEIGTLNVYYDNNGQRHSKCRYHYRSGTDYILGNRILEWLHTKRPKMPPHWSDIVIDKMEEGYSQDEAIEISKAMWDEYNRFARKIEPASNTSERVKAEAVTGIQGILRGLPQGGLHRERTELDA